MAAGSSAPDTNNQGWREGAPQHGTSAGSAPTDRRKLLQPDRPGGTNARTGQPGGEDGVVKRGYSW